MSSLVSVALALALFGSLVDPNRQGMPAPATATAGGSTQDPNEADLLFEMGLSAHAEGRFDEAIDSFQRCLELDPERSQAAYNVACCLALDGDSARALQWLEDAVARGFGAGEQEIDERMVSEVELMRDDPDLAAIRSSEAFVDVLDQAERLYYRDMDSMVAAACRRIESGRDDLAIVWLERAAGSGWGMVEQDLDFLRRDPRIESVRQSERFQRVLQVATHRWQRTAEASDPDASRIDWIDGPRDKLVSAAFSPDGSSFLVAGFDGAVRVYDAAGGPAFRVLRGHRGPVMGAAFSPDGEFFATAGVDTTARIWDRSGRQVRLLRAGSVLQDLAFSPDGRRIVTAGLQDRTARVWDVVTGAQIAVLGERAREVWSVAFSPDGERVAVGDIGGGIAVFEAATGTRLARFAPTDQANVRSLAFDESGTGLLAASWDGAVRVLDARTGRPRRELRSTGRNWLSAAFSKDGARVAGAADTGECVVWELATGEALFVLRGHSAAVADAAFSPDGRRVLTCGYDACARIFDLESGLEVVEVRGRPALRSTASFSPDGRRLSVLGESWAFELDLSSGRAQPPAGRPPITAGADQARESIAWRSGTHDWEGKSRTLRLPAVPGAGTQVLVNLAARVAYVAETPESGWLVGPDAQQSIPIDSGVGPASRTNWELADALLSRARFAPDGARLVTLLHADGRARAWDTDTGRLLRAFERHTDLVTCAAFHPDGERVATGSLDGSARVWGVSDGREHAAMGMPGAWLSALAFSPDGARLASGDMEGNLRIWNAAQGQLTFELGGQLGPVTWLEFAPDGKRLCSTGADESVQMWDLEQRKLVFTFAPYGPGEWLTFATSLYFQAGGGADSRGTIALESTHYPLSCFAALLERQDLLAQELAGHAVEPARLIRPPRVVVLEPALVPRPVVQDRAVTVRLRGYDEGYGVERLVVAQDGEAWPATRMAPLRPIKRRGEEVELEIPVRIPEGADRTVISVQAVNSRGVASREERLELCYEPPKEDLYLLAIGVQDYDDDSLDLSSPRKDAEDIVAFFRSQQGLSFDRVHLRTLLDSEVSVRSKRQCEDLFLGQATDRDTIVAFVAGHGIMTDKGDFYFLTSDATPQDYFSGLRGDDLLELVGSRSLRPQRRLLLIDTCFSGAVGTRGQSIGGIEQSRVDEFGTGRGIYVVAASTDRESARESESNGLFTRAVLDGLGGAADSDRNGRVEVRELLGFVQERVHELTQGRQQVTTPKVEFGQDFPIARFPASGR